MKQASSLSRNELITIALLLFAAGGLRLPSLTLNSFWLDELYTVSVALAPIEMKLPYLWRDVHPPLFNSIVSVWATIFGASELALRLLPAIIGIATAPISYLLFRKHLNKAVALFIAILVILLPSHIYYSQELRSYSLAFLLAIICVGTLMGYLEDPSVKNRWLVVISCAALFATHYISIFLVLVILLISAIGIQGTWEQRITKALKLFLGTFALMLPNLVHLIVKRYRMQSFWPDPVTPEGILSTLAHLFYPVSSYTSGKLLMLIYFLLLFLAIASLFYDRQKRRSARTLYLIILSIVPITLVILVSLLTPKVTVLIPRIILVFSAPFIIAASLGLDFIRGRIPTAIILLVLSATSLYSLYRSSYYSIPIKSDFRSAARELARQGEEYKKILYISLDRAYVATSRGVYYWRMFGVSRENFLVLPEAATADHVFRYIQETLRDRNINNIVLLSLHSPRYHYLVPLFDKRFRKMEERTFAGPSTFLIRYARDENGSHP